MTSVRFVGGAVVLALACAAGVACRRQSEPPVQPSPPEPFGYKCGWLAIPDRSVEQVVAALPLRSARRASWRDGIASACGDSGEVFVSPRVDRWIFVVGLVGLPQLGDSKDTSEILPFVARLSRDLDASVQYFASHRVTETHAWVRADKGTVVRAFGYSGEGGETLFDIGAPTDGEKALDRAKLAAPDEETVMQVAGKWGIDPQTLDEHRASPGVGWIGKIR